MIIGRLIYQILLIGAMYEYGKNNTHTEKYPNTSNFNFYCDTWDILKFSIPSIYFNLLNTCKV